MAAAALGALVVALLVPALGRADGQTSAPAEAAPQVAAAPAAMTYTSSTPALPGAIDVLLGVKRAAAATATAVAPPHDDLAAAPDLGSVPTAPVDPTSVLASGFVRPVEGPITSRFGPRFHPILKVWKLHTGTDISAACGTPVKAAKAGVVTAVGLAGGNGNRVVVDHGQGLATTYNHLSAYAATVGLPVRQGQVIGYVGTTGLSTGCHLHFEVLVNGVLVDSGPYLDLAPSPSVTIPAAVAATSGVPAAPAAAAPAPAPAPASVPAQPPAPSTSGPSTSGPGRTPSEPATETPSATATTPTTTGHPSPTTSASPTRTATTPSGSSESFEPGESKGPASGSVQGSKAGSTSPEPAGQTP